MASILVVDDDRSVIRIFRRCLERQDAAILSAGSILEAIEAIDRQHPDVVVLDVVLPDGSGLDVLEEIRRRDSSIPVVFISALDASATAIEAMKLGGLDYLLKPLDVAKVREAIARAMKIRRIACAPAPVNETVEAEATSSELLLGRCPAMQEVYKSIGRVAQQEVNLLIRGESGTGKELVARAVYQHGPRSGNTFLAVNCAAIPETLLESELFGHEKGSFTGACVRRIGKFEQCNRGTLFLDEIADMTPLMQSKVLRATQEKQFERVGGNETITTDVRIITATNRDLEQMVADGEFRADLYYRLSGYTITLPPLRERGVDIPLLVAHFVRLFNPLLGKSVRDVSPDTLEILSRYPWPGNVRELQSVLKQAMLQAAGPVLLSEFLPATVRECAHATLAAPTLGSQMADGVGRFIAHQLRQGSATLYADSLAYLERILLTQVLYHTGGNQSQAAAILGITRGCLRSKIRRYGITINHSIEVDEAVSDPEFASLSAGS